MRRARAFVTLTLAGLVVVFAFGCGKKESDMGPLEKAGRQADRAVDKALDKADKAVDKALEVADDATVKASVKTRLVADAVVKALKIDVDVKDGVVTLKGSADNAEQVDAAERITKDTAGVRSVKVEIEVRK